VGERGRMASRVNRGEIWLYTFEPPDKRRPVLVLSRQGAIRLLSTVLVAPITSTIHGAPSEVSVGIEEGLKRTSAVNRIWITCTRWISRGSIISSAPSDQAR